MAIRIITGVPGSGKTYFLVRFLVDNYCTWSDKKNSYVPKKGLTIFTNINELKIDHYDLADCIEKSGLTSDLFFSFEYQKKISQKYKQIIYIIDEAQEYFPRKFYNEKTFNYFQKHRHLGHDIFLMTQLSHLLSKDIFLLHEQEITAVPRSLQIGSFQYNVKVNNQIIRKIFKKKSKKIFSLYKSMNQKETEKIKNPLIKYFILVVLFLSFFLYRCTKSNLYHKQKIAKKSVKKESKNFSNNYRKNSTKNYKILSHAITNNMIYIYNPCDKTLNKINNAPFPIIVKRKKNKLTVLGLYDCPEKEESLFGKKKNNF